ncbi:MAG: hypothetical protein ACLGI7_06810 [Gammaproteobacteria bacterium]
MSLCLALTLAGTGARADDGTESAAPRYELGLGYRLGDSGFTLGGYGEAVYEDSRGEPWRAALDSLSAILWWDGGGRWRFFSELEVDDAVVLTPGDSTADDATLILERLHLDYAHTDALKLRIGKFLTPVGRWNLIHAAPLTWTTSRPLITETTFPTNATGAMVHGVLPWTEDGIEYSVYASPGEELFPAKDVDTFSEAWGLCVAAAPLPRTQLGLSFASFEQESSPDRKTLYGLDLLWSWRRFELSGEIHYRTRDFGEDRRDEHGHYLQLVAPLSARLYGVARYEGFHQAGAADDLHFYLLGLNYRPLPAVALKAEYGDATEAHGLDVRDGFRASIAVMF